MISYLECPGVSLGPVEPSDSSSSGVDDDYDNEDNDHEELGVSGSSNVTSIRFVTDFCDM